MTIMINLLLKHMQFMTDSNDEEHKISGKNSC